MADSEMTYARLKQKLAVYRPAQDTVTLIHQTPLLLLVGISGAGKDAVIAELLKTGKYHYIVSHTTRKPRSNNGIPEQDGREYHFIDLAEAERMLDAGRYVEAKMYGGNIYGTSVAEIETAHSTGKIAVTDIEIQGAAEYLALDPTVKVVFLLPPSYEQWHKRLFGRHGGTMAHEEHTTRMRAALDELEHALGNPSYLFVVNDDLTLAVSEIDRIAHGEAMTQEVAHAYETAREIFGRLKLDYLHESTVTA